MNVAASLRSLRAVLAWFLILLFGGEFIQFSTAADSNVIVPSVFTSNRDKLRNYFCNDCSNETACTQLIGCTFCQWLCQSSWGQDQNAKQTVCQKTDPDSSSMEEGNTLCDGDQSMYCAYGDEAEVCESDDKSCIYYRPNYKSCCWGLDQGEFGVFGMRCSDTEMESTTRRGKSEMPSTRQPLATANVTAIVLGTLLAVLLISVALGLLFLFITNRLKCDAGTGVPTADAAIEMAQHDASTRDGTTDHAYKSLHLSHEQSHYYSRIPKSGGNPNAHTAQEEVTPSAPPTEREQSRRSQADNSNHEYFVLEKDEFQGEREEGRQKEGVEDTKTLGKEVDSTIISKSAAAHEGYDHIQRSPQHNTTDNTYSHLKPDPGKEYDHLSKP